jgi:hypothetical protein
MQHIKLLLLLFLASFSGYTQDTEDKKIKFIFQLDNRFSSIQRRDVTLFGAKMGLQYKNITRFGIGISFITKPVEIDYFNKKTNQEETNIINFGYISFFDDLILFKTKKWEGFITEQICFGRPRFSKEINDEIVSDVNVRMFLNEISGQLNYKIFPWLGVGAGAGYRNLWNKSTVLKKTFDAPVYIAKVIIYPGAFFD